MYIALVSLFFISLSGFLLRYIKKAQLISNDLIALGAGSMIAVAIVHILPEALEINELTVFAFIAGFLIIYIVENFLIIHSCVEDDCHYHHVSLISWIAIFIHTLFDGMAIGAGFATQEKLGYIILLGVAIHQIPVSSSLYLLFKESHFSKKVQRTLMVLFALSAPIGFLLSHYAFEYLSTEIYTAFFIALSGGSLLYVGASDLLPVVHKKTKNRYLVMIFFLVGIIGVSLAKFLE